ncbi:MAG TPA: radical SAM protein, partial [Steroidobacteraceae bacterium]
MNASPLFDATLLARYDQPGPRYLSYPTGPHFNGSFGEEQLRHYIQHGNEHIFPPPISLYVHIPYCASDCFYCNCTRVITRDTSLGDLYLENLAREIMLMGPLFAREREVVQLHLGGGTPNFLRPARIAALVTLLRGQFNLSTSAARDFSIELDPRYVEPGDIECLAETGFNRMSLGVQDFAPEVQQAINRA